MIQNYFQLAVTLLIATLILFITFKLFSNTHKNSKILAKITFFLFITFPYSEENSLDSKRRGRTLLISGPTKSGKTLLFQKVPN
jgi:ABC-type uncharacterized transport system fused permease/ATPase subunit